MGEFFLNVNNSATGQAWIDVADAGISERAGQMAQKFGLSSILARLLAIRGVDETQIYSYLSPKLRNLLPNPLSFKDMDRALDRIITAIDAGEKIVIYGDYDVDGACSAAIMWRFLHAVGADCSIHIPHRLKEGYGLNREVLQRLNAEGATLIIAVDCGTNGGEVMAGLEGKCDLVVLDHHKSVKLNEYAYAVVNPNRADDNSGCDYLCAAGLVFIAVVGLASRLRGRRDLPDILGYLDLVALATICDIVPLRGVNRAFIVAGLKVARKFTNFGLQALVRIAQISEPLNIYHLGYIIGPHINAAGRIADSSVGAKLLCCSDMGRAEELALSLQETNKQRQKLEKADLDNIIFTLQGKFSAQPLPQLLVEMGPWHAGIVGLLASRLKDKYRRPAIILSARSDGTAVGSARSIRMVDIGGLIHRAVQEGLLISGGGHAMAAGLTIEQEKLPVFSKWIGQAVRDKIGEFYEQPVLKIESLLSAGGATELLCREIEKAGPFGSGNSHPVFVFRAHKILHIRTISERHLAVNLQDNSAGYLKAVAFNALGTPLGEFLLNNRGNSVHLAGYLRLNHYRNMSYPQLDIIDAAQVS